MKTQFSWPITNSVQYNTRVYGASNSAGNKKRQKSKVFREMCVWVASDTILFYDSPHTTQVQNKKFLIYTTKKHLTISEAGELICNEEIAECDGCQCST